MKPMASRFLPITIPKVNRVGDESLNSYFDLVLVDFETGLLIQCYRGTSATCEDVNGKNRVARKFTTIPIPAFSLMARMTLQKTIGWSRMQRGKRLKLFL